MDGSGLGEPGVVDDFGHGDATRGCHGKHPLQQILEVLINVLLENSKRKRLHRSTSTLVRSQQLGVPFHQLARQVSMDQGIQHQTHSKHVRLISIISRPVVVLNLNITPLHLFPQSIVGVHLRRRQDSRTVKRERRQTAFLDAFRVSKITDPGSVRVGVVVDGNQCILVFDISVDNVVLMERAERQRQLHKDRPDDALLDTRPKVAALHRGALGRLVHLDKVKQRGSAHLGDQELAVGRLKVLDKTQDVFVRQRIQNVELASELALGVLVVRWNDLDGDLLSVIVSCINIE